jgi:NADH dehydrogenase
VFDVRAGGKVDRVRMKPSKTVVIIGGGFAGLSCARTLARQQRKNPGAEKFEILVVDKTNHHLFQPLLYQVATAGLSPADVAIPIRHVLRKEDAVRVMLGELKVIDHEQNELTLELPRKELRKLRYDYLVLATGAKTAYFGNDHWERVAPGLKTLEDATTIRSRILARLEAAEWSEDLQERRRNQTFVIVGGGPTGVEMAGAIAELIHLAAAHDFRFIEPKKSRIVLIEGGERLLSAFPGSLSGPAQARLEKMGVEIRTSCRVEAIDENGVQVNGERLEAATVIWAAGVRATPIASWLGLAPSEIDRSGRVRVDGHLEVPGYSGVFIAGDAAFFEQDGAPLPGVAPVAMQQGSYLGTLIFQRLAVSLRENGEPLTEFPKFRYLNKGNLATVGRKFAIADLGSLRFKGLVGWLLWLFVHVLALIGFRNRLVVLMEWAWAYFTLERGARLITVDEDPQHPIRRLS